MGPFAGRMVETVVLQQLDRQHAPQQTDDDDPYGDPQSSQLPDQQETNPEKSWRRCQGFDFMRTSY